MVDTEALSQALADGEIAAAALDVTQPEPLPFDHPLHKMDNVIIVPHWASATVQVCQHELALLKLQTPSSDVDTLCCEVQFSGVSKTFSQYYSMFGHHHNSHNQIYQMH